MRLARKRVLVTGATGFIGGRLVEKLMLEEGAQVRVLLRNLARAPRLARFPLEMIVGSLTDAASLRQAATGCDVVVHCAFGGSGTSEEKRAATIKGTEAVAQAARDAGVRRLVHLSTISVYGLPGDGDLDERRDRKPCGDDYSDSKLAAEQLMFAYHQQYGLPVSVLQPTIVYGPHSWPWTLMPLAFLKHERVVLVDGGTGLCNAVYVDDVVDAILLAALRDEAVGQAFLISGDNPVTWQQFYGAYEQMLGRRSTVPMSVAEIEALRRERRREQGTVRQIVRVLRNNRQLRTRLLELPVLGRPYHWIRRVTPDGMRTALSERMFPPTEPRPRETPMQLPDAYHTRFFRQRMRVSIDKARQILGYQPRFSFQEGMQLTSQWAAWANLL